MSEDSVPSVMVSPDDFNAIVAKLEPEWRQQHTVIWTKLVEFERELNAKRQAGAN